MVKYCAANSPFAEDLTATEVGATAAFLASPLASGITGATVYVDKGYHAMGMAVTMPPGITSSPSDRTECGDMNKYGSVRLRLIGLALLGALPFIALGVFRLASTASRERQLLATDAVEGARVAAARIDEKLRTADAVLIGLSTTLIPTSALRQSNEDVLRPTLSLAPPHVGNLYSHSTRHVGGNRHAEYDFL